MDVTSYRELAGGRYDSLDLADREWVYAPRAVKGVAGSVIVVTIPPLIVHLLDGFTQSDRDWDGALVFVFCLVPLDG